MHPLIENYLQRVRAQLKSLPIDKQNEEIEELRQHLQAMVSDNSKPGATEDEAVAAAIRQFGDSKRHGSALSKASGERKNSTIQNVLTGMVLGMGLLLVLGNTIALFVFGSLAGRLIEAALSGAIAGLVGSRFSLRSEPKAACSSLLKSFGSGLRVAALGGLCGTVGGAVFGAINACVALQDPNSTVSTLHETLYDFFMWTLCNAVMLAFIVGMLGGIWGFIMSGVNHVRKAQLQ